MSISILVRGLPDAVISAIDAQANAVGISREEWCRRALAAASEAPVMRHEYGIRASSQPDAQGDFALARIVRFVTGDVERSMSGVNERQREAVATAAALMAVNAPGDRERAITILSSVFQDVLEVPVYLAKKMG